MSEQRLKPRGTRHAVKGAALAGAIAFPVVFGVAAPASATQPPNPVSDQGCTVTAQTPQVLAHVGKQVTVRFPLKITCAGGKEISIRHKILEENAGPDTLIHSHLLAHDFPGPDVSTFTHHDDLTLNPMDAPADQTSELYHTAYFRVDGGSQSPTAGSGDSLVVLH